MRTSFQEWSEPKNLLEYPYFAVENAPSKIEHRVSREKLLPAVVKLNIGFQVGTCFQEWSEPKNLLDYPYFAVENAPPKIEHRVSSENLLPGSAREQNGWFYRRVSSKTGGFTAEYGAKRVVLPQGD